MQYKTQTVPGIKTENIYLKRNDEKNTETEVF